MFGVAELVNQDIVRQIFRQEEEFLIEADCSLGGVAAPTRFLIPDDDALEGEFHFAACRFKPGNEA